MVVLMLNFKLQFVNVFMKILFVDPQGKHVPIEGKPGVALNLGLATLSSVLIKKGHTVSLFDMANHFENNLSSLRAILKEHKPDIVGFSVINSQYTNAMSTIKDIRTYTDALILAGGAEATAMKEKIIEESGDAIDILMLGEAEETLVEVINCLENNDVKNISNVKGVIINTCAKILSSVKHPNLLEIENGTSKYIVTGEAGKVKDINSLPDPNMDIFGVSKMSEYKIMASRGCPFKCNFCFMYLGRGHRRRDPDRIVAQLIHEKHKYDYDKFRFFDPIFNLKMSWVHDVCDAIQNSELNGTAWEAVGLRADQLDDDLARHMAEAGCRRVDIGVETLDQEVFDLIDKGETLEELITGIQIALQHFEVVSLYIIIGLPKDTMKKCLYTYNEVKKLGKAIGVKNEPIVNYSLAVPYTATRLKDWVNDNAKIIQDSHDTYTRGSEAMNHGTAYETDDFSSAERLKVYKILQTKEFRYMSSSKISRYITPLLWVRDAITCDMMNIHKHMFFIFNRIIKEIVGRKTSGTYMREYVEYSRIPNGTWWLGGE
jgi:anaerobic magnesium-protoporphyrin IX monomethyl ester cyclase